MKPTTLTIVQDFPKKKPDNANSIEMVNTSEKGVTIRSPDASAKTTLIITQEFPKAKAPESASIAELVNTSTK
jgi:hypothetical protein